MSAASITQNKDKKVTAQGFQVDKNVLYYGNSVINTNNISLISVEPIPANNSWIIALIIALIGLCFFKNGGWVFVLGAVIWIICTFMNNNNRGEYLAIGLNNGMTLYFHCRERKFLDKVVSTMVECMKFNNECNYSVNFEKCVINRGMGTVGNVNIK